MKLIAFISLSRPQTPASTCGGCLRFFSGRPTNRKEGRKVRVSSLGGSMKKIVLLSLLAAGVAAFAMFGGDWSGSQTGAASASSTSVTDVNYDINTVAGKVASLNGTAGLQIRFS